MNRLQVLRTRLYIFTDKKKKCKENNDKSGSSSQNDQTLEAERERDLLKFAHTSY